MEEARRLAGLRFESCCFVAWASGIHSVVSDEEPWYIHRPDTPRIKEGFASPRSEAAVSALGTADSPRCGPGGRGFESRRSPLKAANRRIPS